MLLKNTQSKSAYFLRLAADFAAILELHSKFLEQTFYSKEVYQLNFDNVLKDNPYVVYLKQLINSKKEKLTQLNSLLKAIKNKSKAQKKKNKLKEKMILAIAYPCVLLILYLYFKTYRQDQGVVLVNASIAVKPRTKIINNFQKEGERKDVDKYDRDILLTTTAYVSTRLNITAANNFVLFNPLWMVKDQMQAFARVHCTSQKRQTHLTLLYSNGNLAKQSIIIKQ